MSQFSSLSPSHVCVYIYMLMPETAPTATPNGFCVRCPATWLPAREERLGGEGDTGVVSAVGTPMLKSVRGTGEQWERQSLDKARFTIPGFGEDSPIYRRLSRVRGVGATLAGRLPMGPGGQVGCRSAGAMVQ